jgi:hypothetical protein
MIDCLIHHNEEPGVNGDWDKIIVKKSIIGPEDTKDAKVAGVGIMVASQKSYQLLFTPK